MIDRIYLRGNSSLRNVLCLSKPAKGISDVPARQYRPNSSP
jgi:hypothetical protein